jgi:hypothetical protein
VLEYFFELSDKLLFDIEDGSGLVSQGPETLDFIGDRLRDVAAENVPD